MTTRAKVYVESVKLLGAEGSAMEEVQMRAVGGNKVQNGYPADGSDEEIRHVLGLASASRLRIIEVNAIKGQKRRGSWTTFF